MGHSDYKYAPGLQGVVAPRAARPLAACYSEYQHTHSCYIYLIRNYVGYENKVRVICTVGPSGRQLQGWERRTPSYGAPIYQGSFEQYHIPAT